VAAFVRSGAKAIWWMAGAAAVALAAGVALSLWLRAPTPVADAGPLLAISLPDTEGREQALAQWKGKVLVVNFWATWCAPCREEMPMFVNAQSQHGGRGLQFVGVAIDDADKVRKFAAEIGLNYPALVGGYGAMELSKTLGNSVMALPFTVVVDRGGRIVLNHLGPMKQAQLDRLLAQTL
jgi:thiol-disulfide isomerase/thioredoxin